MHKTIVGIVAAAIFAIGAVLLFKPSAPNTSNVRSSPATQDGLPTSTIDDNVTGALGFSGQKLATNYYGFAQTDYDRLRSENKPMLLYFYANWCPTCALQEPVMITVMNNGVSNGITALRVNYSDSDTDREEKDLGKEFNIIYQHTFVGLNSQGEVVFTINGQQSESDLASLFVKLQ